MPPPQAEVRSVDCSVALLGDSILYGAYDGAHRLEEPPAMMLRRLRPRYTVDDRSKPGDSAYARQGAIDRLEVSARIVVVQYGINDAGHQYPYELALRVILDHFKAEGRIVVVTGLSRTIGNLPGRDENDAIARRLAAETGAFFVDWGAVRFDPADMADNVHPAQAYAERLTQRLIWALDQIAPECASSP